MEPRGIIFISVLVSIASSSPHGYGHSGAFANSGAAAGALAIPGLGPILSGSFSKSSSASFSSSSAGSFGFSGGPVYGNHNPHESEEYPQSGTKQGASSAQPEPSQIASGAFAGSAAFSGAASLNGSPVFSQQPCSGNCNENTVTTHCKGAQCSSSQTTCSSGLCQHKSSETTNYSNPKPSDNVYSTLSPYDTPSGATNSETPLRPQLGTQEQPGNNPINTCGPSGCENTPTKNIPQYSSPSYKGSSPKYSNVPCGSQGCNVQPSITLKTLIYSYTPTTHKNTNGCGPQGCGSPVTEPVNPPESQYSNGCGPQGCSSSANKPVNPPDSQYSNGCGPQGCSSSANEPVNPPDSQNSNKCGPQGCGSSNEPVNPPDSQYSNKCGPQGCGSSVNKPVNPPDSQFSNKCGPQGCGSSANEPVNPPDSKYSNECGPQGCGSSNEPVNPPDSQNSNKCGPQGCGSSANEPVNLPASQYSNECGPQGCDLPTKPPVQPSIRVPTKSCGSKGCGFEKSKIPKPPNTRSPTACGPHGCEEPSSHEPIQPAVEYRTNNCGSQGCDTQTFSKTTQPLLKNCGPNGCDVSSQNAPVKPSTDFSQCGPQGCDNSKSNSPLQPTTDFSSTYCGSEGCESSEYPGSYSPIYESSVCGPQGCKTKNSYDSRIPSPGINYPPLSPQPSPCGPQGCAIPSPPPKEEPLSPCGPQGCNSKPDIGPAFPNKPNQLPGPNYGSVSSGTTIITYTGGFGGPPGILKPGINYPPLSPQPSPCGPQGCAIPSPPPKEEPSSTCGPQGCNSKPDIGPAFPNKPNQLPGPNYGSVSSGTTIITYTGGFGGPPGILKPGINYPPLSPQPSPCGPQGCAIPSPPPKEEPSSTCGPQGCNSKPDIGPAFPNKPNQLPGPNYGSVSSGTTTITYTGGFGGPPGILKPNDFSIPSNPSGHQSHPATPMHGNNPINPSVNYSPPIAKSDYNTPISHPSSTSLPSSPALPQNSIPHVLSGTAVAVGAGIYTGGFGGPPGILKPNDYSFHSPKPGSLNKDISIVIKGFESAPSPQSPHMQSFPNLNGDTNRAEPDSSSGYKPGIPSPSEGTINPQPAYNVQQKHNEKPSGCSSGCGASPYDAKTPYGYGAGHGYGGGIGGLSFSIGGGLSKAGLLNHFAGKVNAANDIAKTIVGSLANAATGAIHSGVNSGSGAYGVSGSFASSGAFAGAGTKGYGGYH